MDHLRKKRALSSYKLIAPLLFIIGALFSLFFFQPPKFEGNISYISHNKSSVILAADSFNYVSDCAELQYKILNKFDSSKSTINIFRFNLIADSVDDIKKCLEGVSNNFQNTEMHHYSIVQMRLEERIAELRKQLAGIRNQKTLLDDQSFMKNYLIFEQYSSIVKQIISKESELSLSLPARKIADLHITTRQIQNPVRYFFGGGLIGLLVFFLYISLSGLTFFGNKS